MNPTRSSPPATPARRWPRRWSCSSCTLGSSARRSPRSFPRRASRSSSSTLGRTSIAAPTNWCSSRGSASCTPKTFSGATNPAVGLLSIGEEPEKGNAVVKEAHQLLQSAGLNFVGNVEGRDSRPAVRSRSDRRRRLRRVRRQCRAQVLRSDRAVHHRAAGQVRRRSENDDGRPQAARLLRARRRAAARRQRREHHFARQVVAARDQERGQGRACKRSRRGWTNTSAAAWQEGVGAA